MSTYKKKKYSIPKSSIQFEDINTIISDNSIYYDIENKGLLNLIKFKEKSFSKKNKTNVISLNRYKSQSQSKSQSKSQSQYQSKPRRKTL